MSPYGGPGRPPARPAQGWVGPVPYRGPPPPPPRKPSPFSLKRPGAWVLFATILALIALFTPWYMYSHGNASASFFMVGFCSSPAVQNESCHFFYDRSDNGTGPVAPSTYLPPSGGAFFAVGFLAALGMLCGVVGTYSAFRNEKLPPEAREFPSLPAVGAALLLGSFLLLPAWLGFGFLSTSNGYSGPSVAWFVALLASLLMFLGFLREWDTKGETAKALKGRLRLLKRPVVLIRAIAFVLAVIAVLSPWYMVLSSGSSGSSSSYAFVFGECSYASPQNGTASGGCAGWVSSGVAEAVVWASLLAALGVLLCLFGATLYLRTEPSTPEEEAVEFPFPYFLGSLALLGSIIELPVALAQLNSGLPIFGGPSGTYSGLGIGWFLAIVAFLLLLLSVFFRRQLSGKSPAPAPAPGMYGAPMGVAPGGAAWAGGPYVAAAPPQPALGPAPPPPLARPISPGVSWGGTMAPRPVPGGAYPQTGAPAYGAQGGAPAYRPAPARPVATPAAAPQPMGRRCTNCSGINPMNATVCLRCGTPLR